MNDLESLQKAFREGKRIKFIFFWGHQARPDGQLGPSCFSQWWPARFVADGVTYGSAEHYMMAEKARLFGDAETREKILSAGSPGAAKALGRKVRGFDDETWKAHRLQIVVQASVEKFGQDEERRGRDDNDNEPVGALQPSRPCQHQAPRQCRRGVRPGVRA